MHLVGMAAVERRRSRRWGNSESTGVAITAEGGLQGTNRDSPILVAVAAVCESGDKG